jgi:hypothetical protein
LKQGMSHLVLLTLDQFEVDRRMDLPEPVHQGRDEKRGQRRVAADRQAAGQPALLRLGARPEFVGLRQHRLGALQDPAAGLREEDSLRPASYQQLDPEVALQIGDRRGDARLGGMAPHRRRTHGARVRHRDEVFQLA